jgi:hypothetical protein
MANGTSSHRLCLRAKGEVLNLTLVAGEKQTVIDAFVFVIAEWAAQEPM